MVFSLVIWCNAFLSLGSNRSLFLDSAGRLFSSAILAWGIWDIVLFGRIHRSLGSKLSAFLQLLVLLHTTTCICGFLRWATQKISVDEL